MKMYHKKRGALIMELRGSYENEICQTIDVITIITAHKRSFGQGDVLTRVSFCSPWGGGGFSVWITGHMTSIQGVGFPACITGGWRVCIQGVGESASRGKGVCPRTGKAGGTHPIGMLPRL